MAEIYTWLDTHPLLWPTFIILARIADVALGTVRTISVVRGYQLTASVLGFCEVMVWLIAVSGVLVEITLVKTIAYGLGFALGNAIGIWVEKKVAMGEQLVTIISNHMQHGVAFALRLAKYPVTEIPARGGKGEVAMCFSIVPRRKVREVLRIARGVDQTAFITVNDIRESNYARTGPATLATGWRALLKKK